MNVDKMRKNMARSTPDIVWLDFNPIEGKLEYEEWKLWFVAMMKAKHGSKFMGVTYSSFPNWLTNTVRVELNVRLW